MLWRTELMTRSPITQEAAMMTAMMTACQARNGVIQNMAAPASTPQKEPMSVPLIVRLELKLRVLPPKKELAMLEARSLTNTTSRKKRSSSGPDEL